MVPVKRLKSRVNKMEIGFLRRIEDETNLDTIRNEEFRQHVKIKPINKSCREANEMAKPLLPYGQK